MNELRKVQINPFTTKCGIQSAIYDKKRKPHYAFCDKMRKFY